MRRLLPIVAAVVLLAAGCGGSSGARSVPGDAVAVVGGESISKVQFDQLLGQARKTFKAQKRPFPKAGSSQYKALQDQALSFLVQRAEFDQKAKDLGVSVSDTQVDARLGQIKKQYFGGSEKRYKAQLKQQGLTEQQVREDIRAQLVSEGIFNKVTKDATVSGKDVSDYYAAHKAQYGQPASRQVRHILVKSKRQADSLYAQLVAAHEANFAVLAKRFSKDPGSAAQGGKLTVSKGQTVPPFDKVAFSLKTGQLSRPVHTQYGWHIIQALTAVKPAKQTPLKDVQASIKQQLLQQKRNDAMTKWVNDTKKDFCSGKLNYGVGYKPITDPCATVTGTTGTIAATVTG
jgi:parvulin-like peptidyl-prolyl isomerase